MLFISCFCFFELSRQKSENTTENVRQYDTFYVSYFRLLFVVFSLFRIVVYSLFCIFAFRLRMRRLITNMLGGVNDNDWIGVRMRLYKWKNTKMRKHEWTTNLTLSYLCVFTFSLFRHEKANIRQIHKMCRIFALPLSSFCIFASKNVKNLKHACTSTECIQQRCSQLRKEVWPTCSPLEQKLYGNVKELQKTMVL